MKKLIAGALLVAILGWVSTQDWDDEVKQEQEYCWNVKTGQWPDYKGMRKQGVCDKWDGRPMDGK